ncbi:MAG: hypothetical protein M3083_21875 [Actinomycetota bacterium]|nr:hypothetical protein [Actinomycetota bacterium]MDQ6947729.1 hypothetical protein [Actinomycetota bacterium]
MASTIPYLIGLNVELRQELERPARAYSGAYWRVRAKIAHGRRRRREL